MRLHVRHASFNSPQDITVPAPRYLRKETRHLSLDRANPRYIASFESKPIEPQPHPLKSNPNPYYRYNESSPPGTQRPSIETIPSRIGSVDSRAPKDYQLQLDIGDGICDCQSAQPDDNLEIVSWEDKEIYHCHVQQEARRIFGTNHGLYSIEAGPDVWTIDANNTPLLLHQKVVKEVHPRNCLTVFKGEAVADELLAFESVLNVARAVEDSYDGDLPISADNLRDFAFICSACEGFRQHDNDYYGNGGEQLSEEDSDDNIDAVDTPIDTSMPCKCRQLSGEVKTPYLDLPQTEKIVIEETRRIFPPKAPGQTSGKLFGVRSRAFPPATDRLGNKVPLFQKYCVELWPHDGQVVFEGDVTSNIYASYRSLIAVAKAMPDNYKGSLAVKASQLGGFKQCCSACGGARDESEGEGAL